MVPIPVLSFLHIGSVPVKVKSITGTGIQKWCPYRYWHFGTLIQYKYWHGTLVVLALKNQKITPPNHIMNYLPQSLFCHLAMLWLQEEVQILPDMKKLQWIESHAILQVQVTSPLPRVQNQRLIPSLGWKSCQHVGNMSARQPNVGTFGQHPPVVATQNRSRHSIFVSGIADIHPICIQVPDLHTQNSSVRFGRNIWLLYPFRWYFLAPFNAYSK
jgi:hypothetical protein